MNSVSNKLPVDPDILSGNRVLFSRRFPELASILGLDDDAATASLTARIPDSYALAATPSGRPTLSAFGVFVHSRYDPLRDAERAFSGPGVFSGAGCLFAGCGLAYLPELYASAFPDAPLVIAEPDIFLFLLCLAARPLDRLLTHRNLVIAVGTPPREAAALLEQLGLDDIPSYEPPAITAPNRPWFDEFGAVRKRNREKKQINANTLRRFGNLWLRNMCRNLAHMRDLPGISRFAGAAAGIPALVLAAGPSLDRVLPFLPDLARRCVVIAVDTAVRACVRAGVEPDFILLVDPQYWAWRHLDGLECPKSVLITESAAWPAVFRFNCRAVFLCSSLFPLGRFLEERTGKKGELGAGGSVSTTAWDFACHLGSTRIYMAGLDLGYPGRRTHFSGGIFEERAHVASCRLAPAETAGYLALYGAGPYPVPDYRGGTVLTDKRLILYAWWFESRIAARSGTETCTLTPEGVRIPGFSVASIGSGEREMGTEGEALLGLPERREEIDRKLSEIAGWAPKPERDADRKDAFDRALDELCADLGAIARLSRRAIAICERAARPDTRDLGASLRELDRIDREILANGAKEVAAMVFETARESADASGAVAAGQGALSASEAIYRNIIAAVDLNLSTIAKFR